MTQPNDDTEEDYSDVRRPTAAELAAGAEKRAQGEPGMFVVIRRSTVNLPLPPAVWPVPPTDLDLR
jgi:hypothetical protein